MWRGADEPHRSEALLAPRRRQPARGSDQDQNWQQQGDGSSSQNELQNGSTPGFVLTLVAVGRRALNVPHFNRSVGLRELMRAVADNRSEEHTSELQSL